MRSDRMPPGCGLDSLLARQRSHRHVRHMRMGGRDRSICNGLQPARGQPRDRGRAGGERSRAGAVAWVVPVVPTRRDDPLGVPGVRAVKIHYRNVGGRPVCGRRQWYETTSDVDLVTCKRCLQHMAAGVERSAVIHYFERRETPCGIKRPYDFNPPFLHTRNPMAVTCTGCRNVIRGHTDRIVSFAEGLKR